MTTLERSDLSADPSGAGMTRMPSDAAMRAAAETYGRILADPDRAREILAARARYDAAQAEAAKGGDAEK